MKKLLYALIVGLLLGAVVSMLPNITYADTPEATDWELVGTGANVARNSGNKAWSNPTNIQSTSNYATVTLDEYEFGVSPRPAECESQYLRATNFGFNIPAGSTIVGIEVKYTWYASDADHIQGLAQLYDGANRVGSVSSGDSLPTLEGDYTFGSSSNMWNTSLDVDDINGSGFGVDLHVVSIKVSTHPIKPTAYIKTVYIRVHYTPPGTPVTVTDPVGKIGGTVATYYGEVTSLGADLSYTKRGFVWDTVSRGDPGDTSPDLTSYSDYWEEEGLWGSVGSFDRGETGLIKGTTYYVRAWAMNTYGYAYGNEVSFTTPDLALWFEPSAIIVGTTLVDRAGTQDGVITWGTNPGTLEVTIGGLEPASSPTAPGTGLGEAPGVLPPPGTIDMGATTGAAGTGLPLQANFQRAANSLDWSLPVTYSVFFMIVAIVVGVGALVASGTIWGWVAGFGATAALFGAVTDSTGSLVMPIWLTILCVLFAIFSGYVWRYT